MDFRADEFVSSFFEPSAFEANELSPLSLPSSPSSMSTPPHDVFSADPSDFYSHATPPADHSIVDMSFLEDVKPILTPPPSLPSSPPKKGKGVAIPAQLPPIPNNSLSFPTKLEFEEPSTKKRKVSCAEMTTLPIQMKPLAAMPVPLASAPVVRPSTTTTSPPSQDLSDQNKRQQRLMKNREAALMSRQRRKDYMKQLEGKVTTLHKENEELKKKIEILESKNSDLMQKLGLSGKPIRAGVIIMAVFFSFVIFLNPVSLEKRDIAGLAPAPTTLRSLQSAQEPQKLNSPMAQSFPVSLDVATKASTPPSSANSLAEVKPNSLVEGRVYYNETGYDHLPFDNTLEESHTLVETKDLRYWIDQSLGVPGKERAMSIGEGLDHAKPDVAYVFCSEVMQILPNVKSHDGKPKLSLLVPSPALEGSGISGDPDHIIQIDCEVVATHILPLNRNKGKNGTSLFEEA